MVSFEKDIEACLTVLKAGGLILYPTDTIWGIGCDATNAEAVQKIYSLKNRPDEKAMIVLVADERDILQWVAGPDPAVFDYLEQTVKPTTVIYENAIGLADNLVAPDGSIAIRICKEEFCRNLLRRFRKPLVSTSANFSGEASPKIFADISGSIKEQVDYVVQYRREERTMSEPSAVVKWINGEPVVLRP